MLNEPIRFEEIESFVITSCYGFIGATGGQMSCAKDDV